MIKSTLGCLALILTAVSVANAHEAMTGQKYDFWCCNGDGKTGDCQAIPERTVKVVTGGYQIDLGPGDHNMVTKPHRFFMPYEKARRSEDGGYHACLYPTEDTLRCFYAPPMGF